MKNNLVIRISATNTLIPPANESNVEYSLKAKDRRINIAETKKVKISKMKFFLFECPL